MPTSAQDRFNKLFENQARPPPPDPEQVQMAEAEVRGEECTDHERWLIPEEAQYPRKAHTEAPRTGRDIDQMTSSGEDEYVSAFKKKPQMKIPKSKSKKTNLATPSSLRNSRGEPSDPSRPLKYLPNGKDSLNHKEGNSPGEDAFSEDVDLPSEDSFGNPSTGHFCVLQLVAKFPYKYLVDTNDRVSQHFFANNKFYDRKWDVYYIDPPASLFSKAILLLPYHQVQQLIEDIGRAFKIEIAVPPQPFTMSFFSDGTPQPQYLGTSTSREDVARLQASIPEAPIDHGECPADAAPALKYSFGAFKERCENAQAANKKNKAAIKKKKQNDHLLQARDWLKQLKRTQRYLGLQPQSFRLPEPDPNLSWSEQEKFRKQQEKKCHIVIDPLSVGEKVPHPFDKQPVIISVDIESYERAHHLITEVGISTLDTLDLIEVPPGQDGEGWMKHIRSRHFRIKEYSMLINKDFCIGSPDAFQFGESEFISLADAPAAVDACFEYPFSVASKQDGRRKQFDKIEEDHTLGTGEDGSHIGDDVNTQGPTNFDHRQANQAVVETILGSPDEPQTLGGDAVPPDNLTEQVHQPPIQPVDSRPNPAWTAQGPKQRKILLVGHDITADLAYLERLGSKIFAPKRTTYPVAAMEAMDSQNGNAADVLASILEALDTATLYRAWKGESQPRSLAAMLLDLGRPGRFLHNAGNDARYTLEALVALAVQARLGDDEAEARNGDADTGVASPTTSSKLEQQAEAGTVESRGYGESQESTSHGVNSKGVFATSLPLMSKPDVHERRGSENGDGKDVVRAEEDDDDDDDDDPPY